MQWNPWHIFDRPGCEFYSFCNCFYIQKSQMAQNIENISNFIYSVLHLACQIIVMAQKNKISCMFGTFYCKHWNFKCFTLVGFIFWAKIKSHTNFERNSNIKKKWAAKRGQKLNRKNYRNFFLIKKYQKWTI